MVQVREVVARSGQQTRSENQEGTFFLLASTPRASFSVNKEAPDPSEAGAISTSWLLYPYCVVPVQELQHNRW